MGYSPWDCKESDTTEVTWHTCMHTHRDSYTHTHTHTHSSEMSVVTIPNEAPGEVLESRQDDGPTGPLELRFSPGAEAWAQLFVDSIIAKSKSL